MKEKLSSNIKSYLTANFLLSFSAGVFSMYVGIFLKESGYTEDFVGNMLSVHTLSTALFSLVGAFLIGQIGSKKSFMLGSIAVFLGFALMGNTVNPYLLIFAGILSGLGFSMKSTGEAMFLSENSSASQRVLVFSINFTVMNAGFTSANFFGGLLANYLSIKIPYIEAILAVIALGGAFAIVSFIPILTIKQNQITKRRNLGQYLVGYKNILANRSALDFLIFNAVIGMGAGMVVPFFSIYLKYALDIQDAVVGGILSFSQFGCVLGGMLIPLMAKKLGEHKSVVVFQLFSIPFLISIAFPQGIMFVAISFFMRSSLMNMGTPIIQNLGMNLVHPLDRANLSSLMSLSSNLTRAIGIAIGGYIMHRYDYNTPYYFTVALYLVATVLFIKLYQSEFLKKSPCPDKVT